jgi:hypothetical protein
MAQKDILEIIEIVKTHLGTNLPTKLAILALDNFDDYLGEPPLNVDKSELAVYMSNGSDLRNYRGESIIVQAQLPGVLNPAKYHTAIWRTLQEFSPELVGFTDYELSYTSFYPGEMGDGGSSSFLIYEAELSSIIDDCDLYS